MDSALIKSLLDTATEAARLGGGILREWAGRFTVQEKSRANLVTEADFASQKAIYELIHGRFPDHNFLGEEEHAISATDSPFRWIVDPLDGTSNYVHGFPYYAVSIGLEYESELVLGVIYDPNRDELFAAAHDRPTTLNGQPVAPTDVSEIGAAMLVASLPITADRNNPAVHRFLNMLPHAQTVQRTGSAALNLAYVACGRIEGFWSTSLKPWDMAAGVVLVRQAGGRITKVEGTEFQVDEPDLLASNGGELHGQIQSYLV